LAPIFLVAPSSPAERIALTAAATRGFLYAASTMGVTGARNQVSAAAPELVARCRAVTDLPIGVGLGVRTGDQAAEIAGFADAVIVGSAFVSAAESGGVNAVRDLAAELADGVRRGASTTSTPTTSTSTTSTSTTSTPTTSTPTTSTSTTSNLAARSAPTREDSPA